MTTMCVCVGYKCILMRQRFKVCRECACAYIHKVLAERGNCTQCCAQEAVLNHNRQCDSNPNRRHLHLCLWYISHFKKSGLYLEIPALSVILYMYNTYNVCTFTRNQTLCRDTSACTPQCTLEISSEIQREGAPVTVPPSQ